MTGPRVVELRQGVLEKNDLLAATLRARFAEAAIAVSNWVSSPGTGKTALLEALLVRAGDRGVRAAALVGDCATVFYRLDGSHDGIALNERSSGPSFSSIGGIPQRICVVAGRSKRDSLRGALAAGLITELVLDDSLARAVLRAKP